MSKNNYTDLGFMKKNVEWGAHIVFLYENESDLLNIFTPFFATGLKNNELCIVVYPNLSLKQKLEESLAKLIDLKGFIKEKKIIFVYYKDFYFENNILKKEKIYKFIDKKINHIGFEDIDGLRTAGDMSWFKDKSFKKFLVYERGLTEKYSKAHTIIMCAYPIKKLPIQDLIDVIQSHTLILYNKNEKFCLSETTERRVLEEKIEDLERFSEAATNRELRMIELKKNIAELEKELKELKEEAQ